MLVDKSAEKIVKTVKSTAVVTGPLPTHKNFSQYCVLRTLTKKRESTMNVIQEID
jgi:ribosomal protein S10